MPSPRLPSLEFRLIVIVSKMTMAIMGVFKATSEEFMGENRHGGWATIIVLLLILLLWQFNRFFSTPRPRSVSLLVSDSVSIASSSFNSTLAFTWFIQVPHFFHIKGFVGT